jgi:hypothetical protein
MWIVYARAPAPTMPYWPGRRWLALLDAASWPALLAFTVVTSPLGSGVVGQVVLAMCAFIGVRGCNRALWHNERYRFITWRLGVPLGAMLALGILMKLAA